METICGNCRWSIDDSHNFCPKCGLRKYGKNYTENNCPHCYEKLLVFIPSGQLEKKWRYFQSGTQIKEFPNYN